MTCRPTRFAVLASAAALFVALFASSASAVTLTYDFDVSGDDGATIDGWTDVFSRAPSFPSGTVWPSVPGGRGTGGFARWPEHTSGNQDSQHPNHIMRSPEFGLTATSSIDFQIGGGQGSANTYTNSSDISPTGNSSGSGQQKFYLRRVSDDTYLLNQRRSNNGNNWQTFTWNSATIAGAIAGDAADEKYTVEWVDTYSGGWGFGMIDDVVLNDVLVPSSGTALFWDGDTGNWTTPDWLDDVPGTGSDTGTYPQDIAFVVNPANITEGTVTVNSNEAAFALTMDTGTNGSGGRPGNGILNITGNTLSVNTDATLSNTSAVNMSPGATLDVGGTLQIDPTATFNNSGTAIAGALAGTGTATLNAASKLAAGGGSQGAITLTGDAEVEANGAITVAQLNVPAGVTVTKSGGGTLDVTGATTLVGQTYLPTNGTLRLSGVVDGSVALTKDGAGTLHLANNNTYTGVTTVNAGRVLVSANDALGDPATDTTVNSGGQLALTGNITLNAGETITINGGGPGNDGALYVQTGGTNEIAGLVQTGSDSRIHVDDGASARLKLTGGLALNHQVIAALDGGGERLEIDTVGLSGTGEFRKEGNGRVEVKIADAGYTGPVRVTDGYVEAWVSNALGTGQIFAQNDGTLLLRNGVTLPNNIGISTDGEGTDGAIRNENNTNTITGLVTSTNNNSIIRLQGGQLNLQGGLQLNNNVRIYGNGTLNVTGQVTGGGTINKYDNGTTLLSDPTNNFTGQLNINGGTLEAAGLGAHGNPSSVNVGSGATFQTNNIGVVSAPVTIAGDGQGGVGAIHNIGGNTTFTGPLTIKGTTISNSAVGTDLIFSGPVSLGLTTDVTFAGAGNIIVDQALGNGAVSIPVTTLLAERYNTGTNQLNFSTQGAPSGTFTVVADGTFSQTTGLLSTTPNYSGSQDFGSVNYDREGSTTQAGSDPYDWAALLPGLGTNDQSNFQVVWMGDFTPDADGDFTFRSRDKNGSGTNVDDDASIFIDANLNGIFEGSEGFSSGSGQAITVTGLTTTNRYPIILGYREGSGDEEVSYTVQGTAGAFTSETMIDPSTQGGLFSVMQMPDNSLIKTGSGILTLNGDSNYNGTTDVLGGTLLVNGTTSNQGAYTVAAGATLGGTGSIDATVTVEPGGFLSPGLSPGTLTVDGDLALLGSAPDVSTYIWELGPTEYDQTVVTGDLTLQDWVLRVMDAGGSGYPGEKFYIFTGFANLNMTGTATVDLTGAPEWEQWSAAYGNPQIGVDAGGVYLTGLVAIPEPTTLCLLGLGLLAVRRRRKG